MNVIEIEVIAIVVIGLLWILFAVLEHLATSRGQRSIEEIEKWDWPE